MWKVKVIGEKNVGGCEGDVASRNLHRPDLTYHAYAAITIVFFLMVPLSLWCKCRLRIVTSCYYYPRSTTLAACSVRITRTISRSVLIALPVFSVLELNADVWGRINAIQGELKV